MASASKDSIALISVRPTIFPNVNSSEGRSRATNRIGGHYCALPPPRISNDGHHQRCDDPVCAACRWSVVVTLRVEVEGDAVLDARRNVQAVAACHHPPIGSKVLWGA